MLDYVSNSVHVFLKVLILVHHISSERGRDELIRWRTGMTSGRRGALSENSVSEDWDTNHVSTHPGHQRQRYRGAVLTSACINQ
jgi:hypothetical protein